jgi:hypothetical protein
MLNCFVIKKLLPNMKIWGRQRSKIELLKTFGCQKQPRIGQISFWINQTELFEQFEQFEELNFTVRGMYWIRHFVLFCLHSKLSRNRWSAQQTRILKIFWLKSSNFGLSRSLACKIWFKYKTFVGNWISQNFELSGFLVLVSTLRLQLQRTSTDKDPSYN